MNFLIDTTLAATTITAAAGLAAAVSIPPRGQAWGNVISSGPAGTKDIALTFDDGPTTGATDLILDILDRLHVTAAFFAIGCNVERRPTLLQRIHERGHVIGNHSFDHSHYGYFRSLRYWTDQIARTDAFIEKAIKLRPAMFRPPLGVKTPMIHAAAKRAGQTVVTWTHRGLDGSKLATPKMIVDRFGPVVHGGDILLLHDGIEPNHPRDPAPTLAAIEPIVNDLRDRGFRFVRLNELIGVDPYH